MRQSTHAHTCTNAHIRTLAHTHARVHTHTPIHVRTHMPTHTHICTHACAHTCMHIRIHAHMRTHTSIHVHTQAHVHACSMHTYMITRTHALTGAHAYVHACRERVGFLVGRSLCCFEAAKGWRAREVISGEERTPLTEGWAARTRRHPSAGRSPVSGRNSRKRNVKVDRPRRVQTRKSFGGSQATFSNIVLLLVSMC